MKKNNRLKLFFMQNKKGKMFFIFSILLLVIFFIIGCNNQIFKEGKDSNKTQKTVLVELFLANGCPACAEVEPFLEQLVEEYTREEMILVEAAPWGLYSTTEVSGRYKWYFPDRSEQGIPNILFNGLSGRIHGLSDYGTIKELIEVQLSQQTIVILQVKRTTNLNSVVLSGTVKNIGNSILTNLEVSGMTFKDRGKTGFRYSVVDIFEEEKATISSLPPGKKMDFDITLEGMDWEGENLDGVIFVQSVDHEKKVIRQSIFLD